MLRVTLRAFCAAPVVGNLQTKLLINGEFVDAVSGKTFDVHNPSSGEVIARVAEGDAADVDKAVVAARRAFNDYRTVDGAKRRSLMVNLADLIRKNGKDLAAVESLDNGKPYKVALAADVALMEECFRYYAGWADKIYGKVAPVSGNNFSFIKREPIGVCGQIIPWNFPLLMAAWKLAPALATGNTVVLKPAEQTPLGALRLGELIMEAGYPAGTVNIITGYGATAGARIATHMDVDKVAFTGSTAVGHAIMKMAAESNLKKVSLELGGKSPLVVCEDADLDEAAAIAEHGIYFNMGQVCTASSRIFVHESVHDTFVAKLKALAEARKMGPGNKSTTTLGPLVSAKQHERVLSYIAQGKEAGATVVTGGCRGLDKGYFVQPTIFTNVTDNMTIAREEIFGPVTCVLKFKTLDEVLERANATEYGLAAGICTNDINKIMKFSSFVKAGTVWVNAWNCFDAAQPFGGFKRSGIGRELGEEGLKMYTEVKTVFMALKTPLVK